MPTPAFRMLMSSRSRPGNSRSSHSTSRSNRGSSSSGATPFRSTRSTRSKTAADAEESDRKKREIAERETKRLEAIEKAHATRATQLDRLKDGLWFNLGLNKYTSRTEVEKKAENIIEKAGSLKQIVKLKKMFKRKQGVLGDLDITDVPGLPLKDILPGKSTNKSFTEATYLDDDFVFSNGYLSEITRIRENLVSSFKGQVQLGIDAMDSVEPKIQAAIVKWTDMRKTQKSPSKGGKRGTRNRRKPKY